MLQAFNSYLYRANLKKRVKAGSLNALRARRKELEREVKKSEKRTRDADARYAARAPARPPPRQKKRTADGQLVRDGQSVRGHVQGRQVLPCGPRYVSLRKASDLGQ